MSVLFTIMRPLYPPNGRKGQYQDEEETITAAISKLTAVQQLALMEIISHPISENMVDALNNLFGELPCRFALGSLGVLRIADLRKQFGMPSQFECDGYCTGEYTCCTPSTCCVAMEIATWKENSRSASLSQMLSEIEADEQSQN